MARRLLRTQDSCPLEDNTINAHLGERQRWPADLDCGRSCSANPQLDLLINYAEISSQLIVKLCSFHGLSKGLYENYLEVGREVKCFYKKIK